jgi:hypothetical protein
VKNPYWFLERYDLLNQQLRFSPKSFLSSQPIYRWEKGFLIPRPAGQGNT